MTQYGKLHSHKGCVNTLCFNLNGDVLVSGSDDKDIIFWDWSMQTKKFSYNSGHIENVFQAHIMPFSDDCTVISSGADGQVTNFLVIFY
jgi:DDB1- and CUL4-associated factor 8